jgi:hypothetical protein
MQIKGAARRIVLSAILAVATVAPAFSQTATAGSSDEVKVLKDQLASQQKQIDQLQKALEDQKQLLQAIQADRGGQAKGTASATNQGSPNGQVSQSPSLGEVASLTPVVPAATPTATATPTAAGTPAAGAPMATTVASPQDQAEVSPLQFHIGGATFVPVGFLDFTGIYRSRTGGSGIGTNFASIPYGTTAFQDNLSEFRLSMQNSRIGFRVDANVKGAHIIGYMEADFLGNNPGNVAVSSNSNTLRSRLYWVDVRTTHLEILGGQTWSLITPGRTGISPLPADLFYTQDIDVNYQAGLVWARNPEFRITYHPNSKTAWAFAVDSPEQYIGGSAGGGMVTFQPALASTYPGGQLNNGTTTLTVPNVSPDFITKLAFDPSSSFHLEFGGLLREFKLWNPPANTGYPMMTHSATGGGGFINLNFELVKGLRIVSNNFWSDGGGRYIFGQAPDLIARADGSPSLIHTGSTVSGFEYTNKNTVIYAYYGGTYISRNFALVPVTTTSGTPPVTVTTITPFGYGYTGSSSGQNRSIQEPTFGLAQTFWRDPKYGALTFMFQYSYLTRSPWYVNYATVPTPPSNAHLNMVFFNLRYTLPGSAPTIRVPGL